MHSVCTPTGTASYPTITALMPQIYLPADMQAMSAGGNISGHNVTLNFNQGGDGSILNAGTISASGNLSVDTQTLSNQANVVDIGAIWSKVSGGYLKTSGTQVQPGGFMAAARMDINAERIKAVNDAFQIRKADGSVDREASDALVAQLKANLGLDYTSSTVEDDIHQDFVKEKKGLPTFVVMALAVAASVMTAGAASAAMGVAMANMTIGQAMMTAALSSVASSAVSQVASGQGLNFGKLVMAGAVGAATAGLTHGITFDGSSFGLSEWGVSLKGTNTLANLAGTTSLSGVTQAIKDGGSNLLWQQAVGVIGTGLVSAGVNTAIYGGSFGSALIGNLVSQGAALAASGIGLNLPGIGTPGADAGTILANALAHGALGCAAASATGRDCAGGAIGGAASAIAAPLIRDQVYADSPVLNYADDPNRLALTVGLATLIGGATGSLLGRDATSASLAAQNEALNNATRRYQNVKDPRFQANVKALGNCVDPMSCRSNAAFLEQQLGTLTDDKIASMCGGSADCVAARQQERGLYQEAYSQALAHQDANVAARDYLGRLSQSLGTGYTTTQLDGALQRYQQGTSDSTSPVDAFVTKAIVGNVALFGSLKGLTGIDSDGGGSSRSPLTSNGTANAATAPKLADDLASKMAKPVVSDAKLGSLIDDLYRDGAKIGTGSTADAVRYETQTGNSVGGVFHTQKAEDYSIALQKWLDSNPNARFSDRSAAENVLRDLQNALRGK